MLSIVIPIYNQDVRPLVTTLMKQCNKLNINYQILCFDDMSAQKYKDMNKELAFRINVNYTEMAENLGRSKIRNWLGKAAFFEYILFLDGDSTVKNKDFIKKYVDHLPTETVIYGGRKYAPKKPRAKKKILHWEYGSKREALPAKKRKKDPYLNFQSNNFLIPEKIFKNHLFDDRVNGYGYEDLLYAFDLQKAGIPVWHIDNPVIHDGLELNHIFMQKTENAIKNLVTLYKENKIPSTRLIKSYEKLKNYNLLNSFVWTYNKMADKIKGSIMSDKPSIIYFNTWKLKLFIDYISKDK
ncbi:MAG: glycosyltransferase [Saprospiraceae bacterium]|jgi:hypothetical protein|nr:glycosyltransferase [Saprospiraceae bacterium]